MKLNENGFGIYKIIAIVFFIGLCFILALPMFFNLDEREKTEACLNNMKEVRSAVQQYMDQRNEAFTGNTDDLVRTGFLRTAFTACPSGNAGDKYEIIVDPATRAITIRCLNVRKFPSHVLD